MHDREEAVFNSIDNKIMEVGVCWRVFAERVPRSGGEQLRASSSLGRSPRANDCIGPTGLCR